MKGIRKIIRRIAKEQSRKDQATKSAQEDALVYGAEEGRDKLRKAAESCK